MNDLLTNHDKRLGPNRKATHNFLADHYGAAGNSEVGTIQGSVVKYVLALCQEGSLPARPPATSSVRRRGW